MEEAVTKKFIHEDSGTVITFCSKLYLTESLSNRVVDTDNITST